MVLEFTPGTILKSKDIHLDSLKKTGINKVIIDTLIANKQLTYDKNHNEFILKVVYDSHVKTGLKPQAGITTFIHLTLDIDRRSLVSDGTNIELSSEALSVLEKMILNTNEREKR